MADKRPAAPHGLQIRRRDFLQAAAGLALAGAVLPMSGGAAFSDTPRTGGILRLGFAGAGAFKLDPHKSTGDNATDVINNIAVFEALTRQQNDGDVIMWLAEAVTPDDASNQIWTIRLKKRVKFHSGREMTADDVIFSLKRIREPDSTTGGHIGPVDKFERVDDHTVRLTLAAPRSWLPIGLSDPYSSIVPADFDLTKPIGTGPFKVKAMVPSQSVTLERFTDYHGTPAALDGLVLTPFQDPAAQLNALRSGQVDIITGIDPSIASEVDEDKTLKLYNSVTGRCYPIQMRTDVAPFNDVRLRQALRLVIDRDAVVTDAFSGYAAAGSDLYGRYDPNYDKALVRKRDIAKAKSLIEAAGLSGKTLELVMTEKDNGTALVLAESAKAIGLTIDVKKLDDATFYNDEYMQRPFFGGDFYPAGPFFLTSSLVDAPHAGLDQIRWRDKEYIDLWNEAATTSDPAKLHDLMFKLQEILFDRGGWIIAAFSNELAAYRPTITGFPDHDYTGTGVYRALGTIGFKE